MKPRNRLQDLVTRTVRELTARVQAVTVESLRSDSRRAAGDAATP
jgi:hypothetical protein